MSERVSVIGLGYVGLPLACILADSGFKTVGLDIDEDKNSTINSGISPFVGEEPGLGELLQGVVSNGMLYATSNWKDVAETKAVFICVDTPIDQDKRPDLTVLRTVVESLGKVLSKGMLVSLESTLPAGVCQGTVIPILERVSGLSAGTDFSFVHCPERVMPGKLLNNMRTVSRVLGGLDPESIQQGLYYYSRLVDAEIYPSTLLEAEMTKTVENAYRDVQIAFANEVGLLCEQLGADAFEVRRLVNTCPYRDMHIPGAGVGGHCLPKDSWLLLSAAPDYESKVIAPARSLNEGMPKHVAALARKLLEENVKVRDPKITILGLAFLGDSDDIRNSPAIKIIDELFGLGNMVAHDPFVKRPYKISLTRDLEKALQGSDCAIFVTDHSVYRDLKPTRLVEMMRTPVLVDGRNLFNKQECAHLGMIYRGVGKG